VIHPKLRQVFRRPSTNSDARNEWRFDVVVGERWLTGSIDRVVIEYDASGRPTSATIYDYKTDSIDSNATRESLTRHYSRQLLAYRDALAAISRIPTDKIRLVLVYTEAGVLQPLDS